MAGRLKRADNSARPMSFEASAARTLKIQLENLPEDCQVRGWLGGEIPESLERLTTRLTDRIIWGLHPDGYRGFDPEIIDYEPEAVLNCERCKIEPCSMGAIALQAINETQVEIKSYSADV